MASRTVSSLIIPALPAKAPPTELSTLKSISSFFIIGQGRGGRRMRMRGNVKGRKRRGVS